MKKQASQLLSCRGGLGEAPYNTPRHSLQRCRSKALKEVGIRKLTLFEISYLKVLKVSFTTVREPRPLPPTALSKSTLNYHKSTDCSTGVCRLVWQNKAFLLKNSFRSYVRGFSTQSNYYRTAHKVASAPNPGQKPVTDAATESHQALCFSTFQRLCPVPPFILLQYRMEQICIYLVRFRRDR